MKFIEIVIIVFTFSGFLACGWIYHNALGQISASNEPGIIRFYWYLFVMGIPVIGLVCWYKFGPLPKKQKPIEVREYDS